MQIYKSILKESSNPWDSVYSSLINQFLDLRDSGNKAKKSRDGAEISLEINYKNLDWKLKYHQPGYSGNHWKIWGVEVYDPKTNRLVKLPKKIEELFSIYGKFNNMPEMGTNLNRKLFASYYDSKDVELKQWQEKDVERFKKILKAIKSYKASQLREATRDMKLTQETVDMLRDFIIGAVSFPRNRVNEAFSEVNLGKYGVQLVKLDNIDEEELIKIYKNSSNLKIGAVFARSGGGSVAHNLFVMLTAGDKIVAYVVLQPFNLKTQKFAASKVYLGVVSDAQLPKVSRMYKKNMVYYN
jgi:hypothetical protein